MARNQLERNGVMDAETDTELIFRYMMNVDKLGFFRLWGTSLDDDVSEKFLDLISVRAGGKPLQYITGEQEFMGFTFAVNPDVLIPRQDTETLVSDVVSMINGRGKKHLSVLDLGCGSGAIGISIAKLCENASVSASDKSGAAIETARKNARLLSADKVKFFEGDLFAPFKGRFKQEKFDIIVSNPPYIRSGDIPALQREIRNHEPICALDGGADGLNFYRLIIPGAVLHIKRGGVLVLEIGRDQTGAVLEIAADSGGYGDFRIVKDLAGNDRVVVLMAGGS